MTSISQDRGYLAFRLLQIAFVVAPILAGIDKYFYVLTDWTQYLSPLAIDTIGDYDQSFFLAVGVVEIIAGLGVLFKPKIFAYVIALWLLVIIINLVLTNQFYDIALRDLGLMLGALALGLLSQKYERKPFAGH